MPPGPAEKVDGAAGLPAGEGPTVKCALGLRKGAAPSGVTTLPTASRPIPRGSVFISWHGHAGWSPDLAQGLALLSQSCAYGGVIWCKRAGNSSNHRPTLIPCRLSCGFLRLPVSGSDWAASSGQCVSHVFSFAARGCLVGMLSLASIQQCSCLTRCTSFRVLSPFGMNMQE